MVRARAAVTLGAAIAVVTANAVTVVLTRNSATRPRLVSAQAAVGYRSADTRPPGTPLPDGLRVPKATRLIGIVFPDVSEGHPVGWTASLVLTGDPSVAFRAMTRIVSAVAPMGQVQCLPAADARRAKNAWCSVVGRNSRLQIEGFVDSGVERRGHPPTPTTSALIRVLPHPLANSGQQTALAPIDPKFPRFRAPLASPPNVGDVVDRFPDFHGVLRIEPGSEAVTTAIGGQMILRITGDPATVFKAYVDQFASRRGVRVRHRGRSRYGVWRSLTISTKRGVGDAYLLMVTNSVGTYLQIRLI